MSARNMMPRQPEGYTRSKDIGYQAYISRSNIESAKQRIDPLLLGLPRSIVIKMWQHIEDSGGAIDKTPDRATLLKILINEGSVIQTIINDDAQNCQCNCACSIEESMSKGLISVAEATQLCFAALRTEMPQTPLLQLADIFVAVFHELATTAEVEQNVAFSVSSLSILVE